MLGASSYWRVWHEARPIGWPPDEAASPLGRRPYDLRHKKIEKAMGWETGGGQ
ncbi:hypothetical protein [Streptomyces lydicus]|uniref:hypothetical protein n=1 Tax=Streptomyces lydicus TaxID=47763 RepID=UPI0037ABD714